MTRILFVSDSSALSKLRRLGPLVCIRGRRLQSLTNPAISSQRKKTISHLIPLQKPNLFIIDMETGNNIFQFVWPKIQSSETFSANWPTTPEAVGTSHFIPNAMSNTIALDVWGGLNDAGNPIFYSDGAVDHILVGDLSVLFGDWTIDPSTAPNPGIGHLGNRKNATNPSGPWGYRGSKQPHVPVTPACYG